MSISPNWNVVARLVTESAFKTSKKPQIVNAEFQGPKLIFSSKFFFWARYQIDWLILTAFQPAKGYVMPWELLILR